MSSSALEQAAAQNALNRYGMTGSKEITGTSAVLPPTGYYFCAILATAAIVVASQVNVTSAVNAVLGAIPVGATVYGKYSSITLTSGSGIGYLALL